MDTPTSKAPPPAQKAGQFTTVSDTTARSAPSKVADRVYRIAALTAGIALLATVV
ncbi:hypothetical protein [Edaphobacter bradus]|uniref:hypothetical protein n=1 Tax=Edaphobacter bradus TaxID=2259016 RepID=UPI0021DF4F03|nr:hypothetical protein [Edaphobacter bradus]